jgi:hypothetical protein
MLLNKLILFDLDQKKDKKEGKLRKDREKILKKIPKFNWGLEDQFEQKFQAYMDFYYDPKNKKRLPNAKSKTSKEERSLGEFRRTQLRKLREGKLSEERIDRLSSFKAWEW